MAIFFWVVDLIIPASMIVIGLVLRSGRPRKINYLSGYRTTRSMRSQEAWDWAQKYSGEVWLKTGLVLLVVICLSKLFSPIGVETLSLIHAGIGILAMIITIPLVERRLKSEFDVNGVRIDK